jgi:serine/threonine-protein kinase
VVAAGLIKQRLHTEIQTRAQQSATSSADAWLLVQRGSQERRNGDAAAAKGDSSGAERAFSAADSLFAAAEQNDAKWAEPPTLRASLAYRRSRLAGTDATMIRRWIEAGLPHANQALKLDPENADALEVRGNLAYWAWLNGLESDAAKSATQLTAAKEDLEHATASSPSQAGAWASLSHLYYQTATASEVNIAAQRAYEADEFLANAEDVLHRLFLSSYDLAQFDKAAHWCDVFAQRFPANPRSVRCRLYLLTGTGTPDVAAAWRLADSIVAMNPPPKRDLERLNVTMLVAAVIARASKNQPALADSARHLAKKSEGSAAIDRVRQLAYSGAFVYTLLGDKDDAMRLLREYVAVNPRQAKALKDDPGWWFRPLQADPRFRQLVGG